VTQKFEEKKTSENNLSLESHVKSAPICIMPMVRYLPLTGPQVRSLNSFTRGSVSARFNLTPRSCDGKSPPASFTSASTLLPGILWQPSTALTAGGVHKGPQRQNLRRLDPHTLHHHAFHRVFGPRNVDPKIHPWQKTCSSAEFCAQCCASPPGFPR
jgi:hypothetical protein